LNDVHWIHLALDWAQWRAVENTLMNLRFPKIAGDFISGWANVDFQRTATGSLWFLSFEIINSMNIPKDLTEHIFQIGECNVYLDYSMCNNTWEYHNYVSEMLSCSRIASLVYHPTSHARVAGTNSNCETTFVSYFKTVSVTVFLGH
jgi:hypothetical protein